MNTGIRVMRQFLVWLLAGTAAGIFLAAVLSVHEYRTLADISGAVMQSRSLEEGMKKGSEAFREEGERFLSDYGYRPLGKWEAYLPFALSACILLFQAAGWTVFCIQYRKEKNVRERVRELTEYLKDVNSGGTSVLRRGEDLFSHLEDEIYKTVIELQGTKESAVRNHEILAERIADIAHQLKTPLTSMSLMTELLEEYLTDDTKEYHARLSSQIGRLKGLVAGLLSLAKLDSHGIIMKNERLELSEVLEEAEESLREMLEERKIIFTAEGESTCSLYTDRQWTEEAILNILKNCAEHTPEGGRITACYCQNPIYTELRIEDGGNGFVPEELPHIFERFYCGAGAAKDNAGIGLAIAKAVIEQQNGYIHAENTPDGHACFVIKWY
ncbi:HAMP domain-containing sensor histidine kinase [Lachnospiraceae bacterium 48-42]